jgi:hypothetical protein
VAIRDRFGGVRPDSPDSRRSFSVTLSEITLGGDHAVDS